MFCNFRLGSDESGARRKNPAIQRKKIPRDASEATAGGRGEPELRRGRDEGVLPEHDPAIRAHVDRRVGVDEAGD